MHLLRRLIREHRALAVFLTVLALSVKIVLPQGYMIGETGARTITVQMCFDGLLHEAVKLVIPMSGKPAGDQDGHGKSADHCPFASLSMGSLAGADVPLLAIALAFILLLGFAPVQPVLRKPFTYLRPPLRGPPALA